MKRLMITAFLIILASCLPQNTKTLNVTPQDTKPTATRTVQPTPSSTPIPTSTPTPVTPTATAVPTNPGTYTVETGDTITGIADKFNIPFGYLADQNKIDNIDFIEAGQVLTIPVWPPKDDGKEIYVILSKQKAYAIQSGGVLKEFTVSTGIAKYPTVTGHFAIYVKYRYADMSGPGYYLPAVPFVMYFYQGYGLHGTYWHHNFGVPMSHGCVNMLTEPDADWLFHWASVGTAVIVIE